MKTTALQQITHTFMNETFKPVTRFLKNNFGSESTAASKMLKCLFVVLSLNFSVKVTGQTCGTVISSTLPITTVATVTTFAGSGSDGNANGIGTAASFDTPIAVARDASGNVYIADVYNNLIRKITPAGVVSTFAGSGTAGNANGTGTAASFNAPIGVTTDPSGNVFVADFGNNLIRKITPAGVVSTLAGSGVSGNTNGTGTAASFNDPFGLATDLAGNVYVAESGNHLIRKITPAGVVSTLAGSGFAGNTNGTGTAASFNIPTGIDTDLSNNLYVSDFGNNLIRKITPAGVVTTLAGSGASGFTNATGTAASFNGPYGVGTDPAGNVYVADRGNHSIRKITAAGVVTTLAGSGVSGNTNGNGTEASFNLPVGITTDATGNIFVADQGNYLIRKIVTNESVKLCSGSPVTLTANGGVSYSWSGPQGITNGVSFNATISGVYTVTVTAAGPCTVSDVITINVSLPTVSAASSAPTVCINAAIPNITHTTSGSQGIGIATGLPPGVSAFWASNTITISGASNTSGTFNYSIPLIDGCGSVQATGTITVSANNTVGVASSTPTLCVNTALTPITHATTGATGIGAVIGFPAGITASWESNTITISGTPTSSGTYNYTIPLTGGCGSVSATGTINVSSANVFTLSSSVGTNAQTICINSVISEIAYNISGATGAGFSGLPAGVTGSYASNVATISGTPTVAGTFNYTVTLTGGCGTASGTLTVVSVAPASSTPTLCINTALTPITHATVSATGIGSPTGLPAGVTAVWAANVITISGTPTVAGSFSYSIPLTGGCGSLNATGTITVNATNSVEIASSTPTLCINSLLTNITHSTTVATGISNSGVSGANGLPAGVSASWASNTITISGTPTTSGTFNYSIPLIGGCETVNATGTITVATSSTVGAASGTLTLCVNTALSITHTTPGATGILTATGLPSGVTAAWASDLITLSGTPTATGTFNYTVTLSGGCGSATGTITVTSVGAPSSSPTILVSTAIPAITHATINVTGIGVPTGLPAGVTASWASNTITISGTPTATGTFNYSIPMIGGGCNATGTITVTFNSNPLDNLNLTAATPAATAFGLRRLSSFYTGPGLRIRRSSDGELRDVYFDGTGALSLTSQVSAAGGGVATATTLTSWISTNSGTVSVWYDQTGLGRNAFQNTALTQPRVILNGAIETQNGKPTLVFSGAQGLETTATTDQCMGAGTNITSNLVFFQSVQDWRYILSNTTANTPPATAYAIRAHNTNGRTEFFSPNQIWTPLSWTNYAIGTFIKNGGAGEIWQNSTNRLSGGFTGNPSGASTMGIARNISGKIAELTIFPSGLSTAERTALECNQANYYTITAPAPQITLGYADAISLGSTSANLPYSYTTATNYSITWSAAAISAGFSNVSSTLLPASSIPVAVPASGPVAGQNYTGVLTVTNNCSGLSSDYGFNIYIASNNVLDNLNLTAATPAAVAYGLRRLTSVYNGAALKIRRSSDGEQRDVYFDGTGGLSTSGSVVSAAGGGPATATTLASWIGANSGTVSVWYDQSGLGRNAFQTTVATQPRFINAGAIETENTKPTLVFSGTQALETTATTTQCVGAGTNITSNLVFYQSGGTNQFLLSNTPVGNPLSLSGTTGYGIRAPNTTTRTEFYSPTFIWTTLSWTNYAIGTFIRNGGGAEVWQNSTNRLSGGTAGTLSSASTMAIARNVNCKIAELTIFPSGLSTAERTALECNQANYYTITASAPQIVLGSTTAISLGTTTTNLPYSYTTATHYSIAWGASAISAGFSNVSSTLLPASSIAVGVPASGPVAGQNYAGVLTVTNNCSGLSANYGFNIYIISNNVLDNLNLTAATPSAVAYGLRRLSSVYTGAGLQIRRSSDGEQRDVYFDGSGALSLTSLVSAAGGGDATATALGTWIGANSGTVSVWYDQSGLGRNAFQTTVATQPRIINAGVIELQNGKPTLVFSGAQGLETTATTTQCVGGAGTTITSNLVFYQSVQDWRYILSNTTANTPPATAYAIRAYTTDNPARTAFFSPTQIWTPLSWTNYAIGTFIKNGGAGEIWQNSTNRLSGGVGGTLSGASTMGIGINITGKIAELTIFPSSLSTAERTALECNQANYYTITASAPQIALGSTTAISLGTTTTSLPYSSTTATNYSIAWGASAISAGFANVSSTVLPASSIPVAVPASGPIAGQNYTGVLTVTNNCSGLSTNYSFNIYILGNNVLDNLNLTAATPAAVAYGLRRLSSVYTGAALQIRRSSDAEQRDVYFDGSGALSLTSLVSDAGGGDATATTLGTWIGANSGTVSVWYDQSGLGRNAFQTTVAAQPRFINAGVLETQNGKPTLVFSGAQALETTATTNQCVGAGTNITSNLVFVQSVANGQYLLSNTTLNTPPPTAYAIRAPNSNGRTEFYSPTQIWTPLSWTNYAIGTFIKNATQTQIWQNRTSKLSSGATGALSSTSTMGIGRNITGKIAELTIFPSGLSTTDQKALECTQAVYYNISLPTATSPSSYPTVCINNVLTNITHTTAGSSGIGTATGLPAGVTASWASNTITISGTPTVSGTFNYSIPLTDGCSSVNATGTIVVSPVNTAGAASSTPSICVNTLITNITHTTTVATGIGTVTGLPAGVTATWASNTITISGTPTIAGNYNYSIPLTGGCGSATATGTITVTSSGTVNTTGAASNSPILCQNTPLTNITFSTTGATGIGAPTGLPPGITAAWAADIITVSGTPTASGIFNYSIPLSGGCGSINATGTITVNPNNTVSTASSAPTLCKNTALTAITHTTTATQGIGISSGLPSGVTATWASDTITITGTPTVAGTFNYSIPLIAIPNIGSCGEVSAIGTITVRNNTVSAASSTPTVCINTSLTSITHTTTVATGIGAVTGLPTGVTANWASNTITISGTPTVSGSFNYSIPLTGGCGSVNATGTITVTAANTAGVVSTNPTLCINTSLTPITRTTTGATGIGSATGLPAGVTAAWTANVLTISGSPSASGTFPYSIPLTGGCGSVNATGTITVSINTAGSPSSNPTLCINTPLTSIIRTTTGATGIGAPTGLPPGVTASWALSNVLTVSGTPTASGTYTYSIPLTGGCGSVNATGTITVTPANTFGVASSTPSVCTNTAITNIIHTTLGATGISNSGVSGANGLPSGVSAAWSSNTITISGTPTAGGTFNYSIPLTGGCGAVNATGTITVNSNTVSAASSTPTLCINTALTDINHTTVGATGIGLATGLPTGVSAAWAGNTITISGTPTAGGTFNYSIPLIGGCGAVNAAGTITVNAASVGGTASATLASFCTGNSTTISLSANTGSTIQWQQSADGSTGWATVTGGSGGTTATYTTPTLTTTTYYRAVVTSGSCAAANSTTATVTVSPVSVGGTATATAAALCTGDSTTISVSGNTGSTIQWQQSANGSTGWATVTGGSGGTTATYVTPNLTSTTYYRAVVTSGSCASANSATATVTVSPVSVGGTATATAVALCAGNSTTISLSGNTGSTIQWQQSADGSTGWATVTGGSGGTTATYTTPTLTTTTYYRAVVTSGSCAAANSATATVTVSPATVGGTATATAAALCTGNSTTVLLSGNTGSTIQWQQSANGSTGWATVTGGSGGTTATYTTPTLTTTTYYRAVVTSGLCAAANSTTATVTVSPVSVGGSIAGTAAVCAGINSTGLTLSGHTGSITRWESSVNNFASAGAAIGNTTTALTATNLSTTTYYRAVVKSGSCTTAYSATALITVSIPPATPGTISGTIAQCPAVTAQIYSISAVANATTYNWTVPTGWSITAGAGTTSITVTTGSVSQNGNVSVTAQNSCGTSTAQALAVTVSLAPPATPGTITGTATQCSPLTAQTYSITAVTDATTYNWTVPTGWSITAGAGTTSITVTTGTEGQDGNVSVTAQNSCGSSTAQTLAVTVSPNLTASVSIASDDDDNIICLGTNVTFTATPTNGGAAPSYQWKLNGTNVGTNSATYSTTTLANGDSVTVTMTSNATPSLTNSPVGSNTITFATGGSTTWNGTSWSNGAPTSASVAIIAGNYSVATNINACSLTVNNNAIVIILSGYNANINNAITVANGSSFTLQNNANLLQQGTTNTNSGAIVVNRNSSLLKRLDYTLWSSPVANQNLLSFSPNTKTNRFYEYVSSTNFYEPIEPSTNVFSTAKGLLIRVPNTHPTTPTIWTGKFIGVPNNGDYNYNMFYNQVINVDPNLTKTYGFNLVGNPYPSPISMTEFINDNNDVINGAFYYWRETNGDLANNPYCVWSGGTFVSNVEVNISTPKQDPNGIIQTGQGFIVEAKSASVLKFKNSQRIANNANQFFRTSQNEERNTVWLNATSDKGVFSQAAISYVKGATQGVDNFDAKVFGTGVVELSSIAEQTNFVIQGRALPFDDNDTVPLGFKATAVGDYSISIDHSIGVFAEAQDIFLKDNMTNIVHNLKISPYTFSTEIGSFNSRFIVIYKNETTLSAPVNNFDLDETISIMFTNNDNMISVKNSSLNTIVESVTLYNLLGQVISTWDVSNENQSALIKVLVRDLSTGTYVVRLKTSEGVLAKKIIIKNMKVSSKTKEKKDIYIQKSMLADED